VPPDRQRRIAVGRLRASYFFLPFLPLLFFLLFFAIRSTSSP